MIFTRVEIELLALCAWCKDLPIGGAEILPADTVKLLCSLRLIRRTRCGLSYRVTPEGYRLLQKAGFEYKQDKAYRSNGTVLTRRLQTAEITAFFWRYGADVFRQTPNAEKGTKTFLPSFALRRKVTSNVLGGTQLAGFCYTDAFTFIPYYLSPSGGGLYADVEQRTFRTEGLLCSRTPFVLYTGAGTLTYILRTITTERCRKEKCTTDTYQDAVQKFVCPVAVLPMNEDGMRQLRILEIPNHREKLSRQFLGRNYLSPDDPYTDGTHKTTQESYLIGFDCNLMRFERAIVQNKSNTHILLLSAQVEAVREHLKGRRAILHPIDAEIVEQILGLPPLATMPVSAPFQTEKGEYLNVSLIR